MSYGYHDSRLVKDRAAPVPSGRALWRYYFRHRIAADDCVLDLGCGYGDFINNVSQRGAGSRSTRGTDFAATSTPGVEAIVGRVTDLGGVADRSIDFAFASNLFEHISQSDFAKVLAALKPSSAPRAR